MKPAFIRSEKKTNENYTHNSISSFEGNLILNNKIKMASNKYYLYKITFRLQQMIKPVIDETL